FFPYTTLFRSKFFPRFGLSFAILLYIAMFASLVTTGWSESKLAEPYIEVQLPVGKIKVTTATAQSLHWIEARVQTPIQDQSIYFGPYASYLHYIYQVPNPLKLSQVTP